MFSDAVKCLTFWRWTRKRLNRYYVFRSLQVGGVLKSFLSLQCNNAESVPEFVFASMMRACEVWRI